MGGCWANFPSPDAIKGFGVGSLGALGVLYFAFGFASQEYLETLLCAAFDMPNEAMQEHGLECGAFGFTVLGFRI